MDYTVLVPDLLNEINKLRQVMIQQEVKSIPPSEARIALWKKLNRGFPENTTNFKKDNWLKWLGEMETAVKESKNVITFIDAIKTSLGVNGELATLNYNFDSLIAKLQAFDNAIQSHSETGWRRTINRRAVIFRHILDRYFADEWDIQSTGDHFDLTRRL